MKKIIFLLSCLFLFSCTAHPNYDSLIESNVIIETEDRDEICGGTIIQRGVASFRTLTAAHCILNDEDIPRPFVYVKVSEIEFYQAKILKFNKLADLAVLETVWPVFGYVQVAQLGNGVEIGSDVWAIGMPGSVNDAISKGIIGKVDGINWTGQRALLVDITSWYGGSGGGLFNQNSQIIGVITQLGPQVGSGFPLTGFMYAVPIDTVRSFLRGII